MLQKHIIEIKKQNLTNQSEIEEVEQYGGRQCLRFEGVPTEQNETSDKVLSKVVDMCKEAGGDIPDTVIDRAHRIGEAYFDNNRRKIVRVSKSTSPLFAIELWWEKKNIKNVRIKLDLTKKP